MHCGDSSLPPNDLREQWIQRSKERLRQVLNDPAVRAEIAALLSGEESTSGSDDVPD